MTQSEPEMFTHLRTLLTPPLDVVIERFIPHPYNECRMLILDFIWNVIIIYYRTLFELHFKYNKNYNSDNFNYKIEYTLAFNAIKIEIKDNLYFSLSLALWIFVMGYKCVDPTFKEMALAPEQFASRLNFIHIQNHHSQL